MTDIPQIPLIFNSTKTFGLTPISLLNPTSSFPFPFSALLPPPLMALNLTDFEHPISPQTNTHIIQFYYIVPANNNTIEVAGSLPLPRFPSLLHASPRPPLSTRNISVDQSVNPLFTSFRRRRLRRQQRPELSNSPNPTPQGPNQIFDIPMLLLGVRFYAFPTTSQPTPSPTTHLTELPNIKRKALLQDNNINRLRRERRLSSFFGFLTFHI